MKTAFATLSALLVLFLTTNSFGQVNVAAPGESGFGGAVAAAFNSDGTAIGLQLTATMVGIFDASVSLRREVPDGGYNKGFWVKGFAASLVPLRTRNQPVRWNLGATFAYEFANVSYPTYSYEDNLMYTGSASRSLNVTTFGGLLFVDIDISPSTYMQIVSALTKADVSKSSLKQTFVTGGLGFVAKPEGNRKVNALATVTIPTEGSGTTLGVQISMFWEQRNSSRR